MVRSAKGKDHNVPQRIYGTIAFRPARVKTHALQISKTAQIYPSGFIITDSYQEALSLCPSWQNTKSVVRSAGLYEIIKALFSFSTTALYFWVCSVFSTAIIQNSKNRHIPFGVWDLYRRSANKPLPPASLWLFQPFPTYSGLEPIKPRHDLPSQGLCFPLKRSEPSCLPCGVSSPRPALDFTAKLVYLSASIAK